MQVGFGHFREPAHSLCPPALVQRELLAPEGLQSLLAACRLIYPPVWYELQAAGTRFTQSLLPVNP